MKCITQSKHSFASIFAENSAFLTSILCTRWFSLSLFFVFFIFFFYFLFFFWFPGQTGRALVTQGQIDT